MTQTMYAHVNKCIIKKKTGRFFPDYLGRPHVITGSLAWKRMAKE
jgi:hypothetical protein